MDPFAVDLVIAYLRACGSTCEAYARVRTSGDPADGKVFLDAKESEKAHRELLDEYCD